MYIVGGTAAISAPPIDIVINVDRRRKIARLVVITGEPGLTCDLSTCGILTDTFLAPRGRAPSVLRFVFFALPVINV